MSVHKTNASIMKIDLQKAYDVLDWGYMQSLLAKISLNLDPIRWIMACIENVNYVVLVNGIPSPFFRAEWGLRQGCPLSPLLFILAINALSLHINRAVEEKAYVPVKICKQIHISHNLFVDDVLLFAMLSKTSWMCFKTILDRFQRASWLAINKAKSILYHNETDEVTSSWISQLFGIDSRPLSEGIKYLGFHLKSKAYLKEDWRWLVERFFSKISLWEYRSLSLGGRVVLAQTVLMQMSVYWAHLYLLPASIIQAMNRISANFIWGAKDDRGKIHLSKLNLLTLPKKFGAWGLVDVRIFGKALVFKSLWRGIFDSNPWSAIIHQKYKKGRSLEFWLRFGSIAIKQGSTIWLSFKRIEKYFLNNLKWRIFSRRKIFISFDSFAGFRGNLQVPDPLLFYLHRSGIFTWNRVIKEWRGLSPLLKNATDFGLPQALSLLWDNLRLPLIKEA